MKLFLFNLVIAILLLNIASISQADNYYDKHAEGWHWYVDPPQENPAEEKAVDPRIQMKAVREALQHALDQAILHPTPEHVKQYITLQNQMSDRASEFAQTWKNVLLYNPELDFTLTHPTNQVASQVYRDEQNKAQDEAIRTLAKTSGLFFFYRSNCPYCQRFAPVVKAFSQRYGIAVIPITLDGVALPEFPNSRIDQGQAARFHAKVVPALFTVNPYTQQAVPVSYGLTSEAELRNRILQIAQSFPGGTP